MKKILSKVDNRKRKRSSSGNEASLLKIKRKDANASDSKLSKVDDDNVGEDGRDLENVPGNEGICNRKKEEESGFENVVKMLKLPQSRNAGLKKFSEICRKDNENVRQSIRTYLLSSPELKDLFNLLEGEERPSDQEAKLIWNAFESILLLTSNSEKSLQDIGMYIVNKILSKYLKMLYSAISLSSPHDVTKSVLKLLTSFVAQGRNGAAEVLNTFDFGLKGLEGVSKKRDNKAKIDVRTCYLQFYLSFFIFGDQNIIKDLLSVPVFTNGVVNGLMKDSLPMVHLVLSTLNEKVVKNEKLLKKTKIALFNAHTLSQLTQLFVNLKNQDNEKTSALRNEIQNLIIQMLNTLCTDAELGILFTKNEGNLAARSNNPILLNFLRSIQKLAVSDPELRGLTSKTLAKAPDLVLPYTSRLNLNLEPRDSDPWLNSMGFLIEVWTQLPSFEGLFDDLKSKKSVQLIIGLVIPSVFGKQYLTNGLKHKSLIVKQKTAELLKVCLQRGTLASKYISQQEHLQKQMVTGIFEMFCEGILSHLPDVRVFIACMEHSGPTDSKNASAEKSTAGNNGLTGLKPGIQEDDFQNSVIQIMLCIQQLQPGIFSSADYSVCKLFKNENLDMFLQSERLSVALEIASLEPVGNLKWFGKKSDLFQNALRTIYIAFAESASLKIKNASRKLIKQLIFASGSITENIDEIEVWLDAFAKASEVTEDRMIASFFQKMCASVSQDLYYITDEILECATANTACEESTETGVLQSDVHASNYSIGFTPLVVAAARNFTKHWLNENESVLMSVSKFVSFVLMEVLMSQENPITLLRIIKKYVSVLRENDNAANSGWLTHWLELENFACYWCSDWNETIRQSSQSFSKCTTGPLVNSTAAILRSKLPFSTDEFTSNSHTASFLIVEITKVLKDTPTSYVCDVIGRSTRVVLVVLRKSCGLRSNGVSSFALILLKKILLVLMERLPEVREYEMGEGKEKKINSFEEVFQVVFNDAVVKKLFLDCKRVVDATIVTEIMELTLGNAKSARLMTFLGPYFAQLSTSVLKAVKSFQEHPFNVEGKPNKLVFMSLDIMANHMLNSDRNDLLSGLLNLLLDCDLEASVLEDSGMIHAIRLLLDIRLDKTVNLDEPRVYSSKSVTMKDSLSEVGDARKLDSIEITAKGIAALFTLLENYDNSDLQGAILSLLEADNLNTYLAPISIVDFCLRSGSGTSIKILELLCQSSVVHASIIRRKLISNRELFTLSSLVHILHTLLSKGCREGEKREKLFIQVVSVQDLMPLIANPEDFPQVADHEVKMALEIVASSIGDREALSAILVKGLRKLTRSPKISSHCSYQIQLFQDVCVPEEASKSASKLIMEALIYLMKIWERTLSLKDSEESLEQSICGCINKLCNSLQKGTISKLKDYTLEQVIKNWSTLLPSCLKRRIGHPESMVTVKNL
ncbi:uncharacterized protein LOC135685222 [Rhopilema esculentum]|uniref:uncharacterized protein LOC135685222 n=1 Tax=Rhopilema esculentum TaxID=499914 RepID=UPI0031DF5487